MNRIYLDHNGTTPLHIEVLGGVCETLEKICGNPSSVHQEGQKARCLLEDSRREIASLLEVAPEEIYLTSGGTEANNIALFSHLRDASRENPQEVITTPVEHPSVLSPLKKLAEEGRIEIKFLPINSDGILQIEALKDLITDKTALVSVMLVNNELGTLYPLQKISEMCSQREKAIPIHCDAIQAVGRIGVLPGKLGVDSISLSAHKFYGPKGVGALWAKQSKNSQKNSWLIPRQWGGGQEAGIRAGTENLPGIVGFGIAARIAKNSLRHWQKQIEFLRDQMEETILARIQGAQVNGGKGPRIYSTSNIHFPGVPGDVLQQALDIEGIAVSTGSACSSGTVKGSHVLRALGQNNGQSAQAIRISLGKDTSVAEIQKFQDVLFRAVQQIREAF